jgi:hypothetical protein
MVGDPRVTGLERSLGDFVKFEHRDFERKSLSEGSAAKVATPAKVASPEDHTLAALASFAGGPVQTDFFLSGKAKTMSPDRVGSSPSVPADACLLKLLKLSNETRVENLLPDPQSAKPATVAKVVGQTLTLAEALDLARAHRVSVAVDGGRLIFIGADRPPSAEIVAVLRRVGSDLLPLVPLVTDQWLSADWRWFFAERTAAAEQSGLARPEAEARALASCVVEWLNRRLVGSPPDRCCWCGGMDRADQNNALLPFGVGPHAWVHSSCWQRWRDWRRGEAVAALAAVNIHGPEVQKETTDG